MTGVLAGALGLVVGLVIGTLGGGGGVLAVPALVYALGQDARTATTGSIIIVGVISVAGVLTRLRGRSVDWRTGLTFGVVGVPTAWAGSLLNRTVPQPVLLLSFAALTLLVAVVMLVNGRSGGDEPADDAPSAGPGTSGGTAVLARATSTGVVAGHAVRVVVAAAVVGFLTGFLGVGGGFLVVPALVMVLGTSMPVAIGTSLLVIALNSVTSLAARIGHLELDWSVVLPFTAVAIAGALAGKLVADRMSSAGLSRAFAILLVVVGLFVGAESVAQLGVF